MNEELSKGETVAQSDLETLLTLQKELYLIETQVRLAAANVEIQKLRIQKKYALSDTDSINTTTGQITRA